MKKTNKIVFPILLVLSCCVVYFWQNALIDLILPYLQSNTVIPVAILSSLLLILTFLATLTLLKQSKTSKPVRRSIVSAAVMLLIMLFAGFHFLNYAARRYAGILPMFDVPEIPGGIFMVTITALCIVHLTGLLICRLVKEKAGIGRVIPSIMGWLLLNGCLFLLTI